jgi:hypothetical protein
MIRILTLTPNPSIDTSVERIVPVNKLRCTPARRHAGGGGFVLPGPAVDEAEWRACLDVFRNRSSPRVAISAAHFASRSRPGQRHCFAPAPISRAPKTRTASRPKWW